MSTLDPDTLHWLLAELFGLLLVAAFFSATEAALTALNRNRIKQLAEAGQADAARLLRLLKQPERIAGLGLIANYFVLVVFTQTGTVIALNGFAYEASLPLSLLIAAVLVVFGAVIPRSLAGLAPERWATFSAPLLVPLVWLSRPLTALLTVLPRLLLQGLAGGPPARELDPLNREELRAALQGNGATVPQKHRDMLFGLLDLENVTVEDVMVPRPDVVGVDLEQEWADILEQLATCRHTRVPCYYGNLDDIAGILHLRNLSRLLRQSREFSLEDLEALLVPPHFVPLGANLYTQLLNFQLARQRMGLVVDEYGDIQGLVTLDDVLEQVVGEFTTVPQSATRDVSRQADGSFMVDGAANVRELNRSFGWSLPEQGPKTLNGLILEALEDIPEAGTSFRLGEYTIEIVQAAGQTVRIARVFPPPGEAAARARGDAELGD